jgi:SAM-dependent methyltransferase
MIRAHPSSFRDPQGFIFEQDGVLYRQVNEGCRADYEALMGSGLYDELVANQLLVSHVEVSAPTGSAGAYRVLRPDRIPFVSYPFEWCFSQLKDAALATLRIQEIALRHGMSLRDSSAFNVQYVGSRPVFIDTLSFERYVEGRPWVGYRQFCQHFLAPLFLTAGRDPRLSALSSNWIDGIPLDLARRLAGARHRWRLGFLMHVGLHSRAQERLQATATPRSALPRLSRASLTRILESLRATIERLAWNPGTTQWADYYSNTNYPPVARETKRRFVASVVEEIRPSRVIDLGANTGEFSAVAARSGAYVVAADMDQGAVELCFRRARAEGSRILPLVVDLTNPTPGLGWMNVERASFLQRCSPGADVVLALALLHHLVIGNNVPLPRVVELLALAGRNVVVELVEKPDSQVQRLLASREDIFEDYSAAGFESTLSGTFRVVRRQQLDGTHRVMYHLRRT